MVRQPATPSAVRRRFLIATIGLVLLGALDALWLEPRVLLVREDFALPVSASPLRIAHLSDLHLSTETPRHRRLLRQLAAARPDLIVLSGDLIADVRAPGEVARNTATAAAFAAALRRLAPVYAVQGHSEYLGQVMAGFESSGLAWLSNQGVLAGSARTGPAVLLLGLNQQVGEDRLLRSPDPSFAPLILPGGERAYGKTWGGRPEAGAAGAARSAGSIGPLGSGTALVVGGGPSSGPRRNFYASWDPAPAGLGAEGGALGWHSYEVTADVWIDRAETAVGIAVHCRYALGDDRLIRLARARARPADSGTFILTFNGSHPTSGQLDTGVRPEPGRWYRLRVRTLTERERVLVWARAWAAGESEPARWQAWAEDRGAGRATAGTVALWAWGGGTAAYRDLRVVDSGAGGLLLAETFRGGGRPPGWRDGARGSRLEMALARSPAAPPETARVVLSHSPDAALEAAARGIDLVLAGHTHGGQVRLPLPEPTAITTRSRLGRHYDRGLFVFAGTNPRGWTWLELSSGVGTSRFPIRFLTPPSWAILELGTAELRTAELGTAPLTDLAAGPAAAARLDPPRRLR